MRLSKGKKNVASLSSYVLFKVKFKNKSKKSVLIGNIIGTFFFVFHKDFLVMIVS